MRLYIYNIDFQAMDWLFFLQKKQNGTQKEDVFHYKKTSYFTTVLLSKASFGISR